MDVLSQTDVCHKTIDEIDHALHAAKRSRVQTAQGECVEERRIGVLSQTLRLLGGTALLLSAAVFMFQNWGNADHVLRYYYFLSFTVLLAASGFLCGLNLREDKGARTFLALAACMLPVNFMQLGGLVYSASGLLDPLARIPSYFVWTAPSLGIALFTTVLATIVLSGVCYTAFSALVRSEARFASAIYMGSCLALVIPSRMPGFVGGLVLSLCAAFTYFELSMAKKRAILQTKEGLFVRMMCAAPAALLAMRSLYMYPTSDLFSSELLASAALMLFCVLPSYLSKAEPKFALKAAAVLPIIASWAFFVSDMAARLGMGQQSQFPLVTAPLVLVLTLLGNLAESPRAVFHVSALSVGILGTLSHLSAFPGVFSAFCCIALAVCFLLYGQLTDSRAAKSSGTVGFVYGCLYYLHYAIVSYDISPWIVIAIFGILLVLCSSLIEREFKRIQAVFGRAN